MRVFYSFQLDAKEIVAGVFHGRFLISHKENGAPFLVGEGVPFISISHSGKLTVVAVSSVKIGVDAEKIQMRERVRREYAPETRSALQFTRWWTEREAFSKWTEEGVLSQLKKTIPSNGFLHFRLREYDICIYTQRSEVGSKKMEYSSGGRSDFLVSVTNFRKKSPRSSKFLNSL